MTAVRHFRVPQTRARPAQGRKGFSLLELLAVMTIIAILATITFTITTGVRERGRRAQAKAELEVIAVALDQYKSIYGDYPWIPATWPTNVSDNETLLFNALAGKVGPKGQITNGRTLLEFAKFHLEGDDFPENGSAPVENRFMDPWGSPYRYFFRQESNAGEWDAPGFLLVSPGTDLNLVVLGSPDDTHLTGIFSEAFENATAVIDGKTVGNVDNIYVGRN